MDSLDGYLIRRIADAMGGPICARRLSACCSRFRRAIGPPPRVDQLEKHLRTHGGPKEAVEVLLSCGRGLYGRMAAAVAAQRLTSYPWETFAGCVIRHSRSESASARLFVRCATAASAAQLPVLFEMMLEDRPQLLRYMVPTPRAFCDFVLSVVGDSDFMIDILVKALPRALGRRKIKRYLRYMIWRCRDMEYGAKLLAMRCVWGYLSQAIRFTGDTYRQICSNFVY